MQAGFYNVNEPCPFRIKADGTAEELSFFEDESGVFPLDYARMGNLGNLRRASPERSKVLIRILESKNRPGKPDAKAIASDAADLIRTRQYDLALNLLMTQTQDDFHIQANLIHLYAVRGEWRDAFRRHVALEDMPFPEQLAGCANQEQRDWLKRVEKYYRKWLEIHIDESSNAVRPEREGVFPLFGKEEPKDAVAIVQQLLLWCPDDNRLFWLLAELYAKSNRPRQAKKLFDSLAGEDHRQSNRKLMMEQREAIHRKVATLPPLNLSHEIVIDSPAELPDTRPWHEKIGLNFTQLIVSTIAFALMAVVLLGFQFRRLARRHRH